jgi:hypothetical protein
LPADRAGDHPWSWPWDSVAQSDQAALSTAPLSLSRPETVPAVSAFWLWLARNHRRRSLARSTNRAAYCPSLQCAPAITWSLSRRWAWFSRVSLAGIIFVLLSLFNR